VPRGSIGGHCGVFSCVDYRFLVEFGGRVRPRTSVSLSDPRTPSAVDAKSWGRVKASYHP
jgi:hypothetical protein